MDTCTISTLNMQGHGPDRIEYLNKVFSGTDILMVQEHWLHEHFVNNNFFETNIVNSCSVGKSSMRSDILLAGRPYGGCAILWHRNIMARIKPLDTPCSRLCGIEMDLGHITLLIFNIHMPTDTTYDRVNLSEFESVLGEISRLCDESNANQIIIGGDFNTDFRRHNSLHTQTLNGFVVQENLCNVLYKPYSKVDYTFESKSNGARSVIDHILLWIICLNLLYVMRQYMMVTTCLIMKLSNLCLNFQ